MFRRTRRKKLSSEYLSKNRATLWGVQNFKSTMHLTLRQGCLDIYLSRRRPTWLRQKSNIESCFFSAVSDFGFHHLSKIRKNHICLYSAILPVRSRYPCATIYKIRSLSTAKRASQAVVVNRTPLISRLPRL